MSKSAQANDQSVRPMDPGPFEKDFVMLCPSASEDNGLSQAVHALYYLPHNYKLTVLTDTASSSKAMPFFDADSIIMNRIRVETERTGLSEEASPFSYDAVIYGENTPLANVLRAPKVVISKTMGKAMTSLNGNGFAISADSPEALASAVMRIARAL